MAVMIRGRITSPAGTWPSRYGYRDHPAVVWPAHLLAAILFLMENPAVAGGIAFGFGEGSEKVDVVRLSVWRQWSSRWLQRGDWHLSGYWEAALDHWNNEIKVRNAFPENLGATHEILAASVTPVFRWQRHAAVAGGLMPFVEAGVGGCILSNRRLAAEGVEPRRFGMRFQFVSRVAAGFRFGEDRRFEIKLSKHHYSNADIHHHNQGMDLLVLSYGIYF